MEKFLQAEIYYTKNKAVIKETGIRWLLSEKKHSEKNNVLETIDWFLDLHLWFLPIPRFSKRGRDRPLEEQKALIYKIAVEKAIDFYEPESIEKSYGEIDFYEACNVIYVKLYPCIKFLRTTNDFKRIALVLCLLALDAKTTSFIKTFDEDFDIEAKKIIEQEIGKQFKTITEMLEAVSSFLNKGLISSLDSIEFETKIEEPTIVETKSVEPQIEKVLTTELIDTTNEPNEPNEPSEPSDISIEFSCSIEKWISYAYAVEMDLLNVTKINAALINFARKHALDLNECLQAAYIRNLAEEKIKIRICKK
jgi:hypothetical protein